MRARDFFALLAMIMALKSSVADEWPPPKPAIVSSPNGRLLVRIVPDTESSGNSGTGGARAEFYAARANHWFLLRSEAALVNPVSPVFAVLTDNGYLITFDNWYEKGRTAAIAFYGPYGDLIRQLTLSDLYGSRRVELPASTPSTTIHWLCRVSQSQDPIAGIVLHEALGGTFVLTPETGRFEYRAGTSEGCDPRRETTAIFAPY